jgi:hypothetical protein
MFLDKTPQGIRKDLDIRCDGNELNEIKLIRNKVSCANQATDPRMLGGIFQNIPEEERANAEFIMKTYVKAALDSKSEAQFIEENWWSTMILKYKLTGNVFIDFNTGDFYINE